MHGQHHINHLDGDVARSSTTSREREGAAQTRAGGRAVETPEIRDLVLHPPRTGEVEVGADDATGVRRADGAHADQRAAQVVVVEHVAGPPPQHLSATHGHEHLKSGGNACQRVPCSHKACIAVSNPSSVGRGPSRKFHPTLLDHNHSRHLSATHGHDHLKSGGSACQRGGALTAWSAPS